MGGWDLQCKIAGAGVVEVGFPGLQALEAIHHGAVESRCIASDQGQDQDQIRLHYAGVAEPCKDARMASHRIIHGNRDV